MTGAGIPAIDRFWASVEKTDTCWLWTAGLNSVGYGRLHANGQLEYAHRFAYRTFVGEVTSKQQVDHLCFVRHCVNPAHLRATSPAVNNQHRKGANKNSLTGVRGVSKAPNGRWVAGAKVNYKFHHLGTFDTVEEAGRVVAEFWEAIAASQREDGDAA